ncbi:MAG: hypothetical protein OXI72_04380 [Gemmatimonadota bacterium]|nr:hypothetical protein [Gemmatimonadota bacterium]
MAMVDVAKKALKDALACFDPTLKIDSKGYVNSFRDNLVPLVCAEDFEEELQQGDGNELDCKFRAAHSSSALAVNSFGPFKRCKADLKILDAEPFGSLHFERKCPTGLRGNAPNLDIFLEGESGIIGIESKLTEHLTSKRAKFSSAYEQINEDRRKTAWFTEMLRLMKEPESYVWLDAAQLIKHAFGLTNPKTFCGKSATLLYLYWEPLNAARYSEFFEHRREIEKFAKQVCGSSPSFRAMSYHELWSSWGQTAPDWLMEHLNDLKSRYGVCI